MKQTIS